MRRNARPSAILLGLLLALAAAPAALAAEPLEARCVKDALDDVHCARDPKGVAVIDSLGVARCAAGHCVQVDDEWHCSTQSGGSARLEPAGPVCDGSCAEPKSTDCLHEPD
jgi:hypothetical protein